MTLSFYSYGRGPKYSMKSHLQTTLYCAEESDVSYQTETVVQNVNESVGTKTTIDVHVQESGHSQEIAPIQSTPVDLKIEKEEVVP